MSMEKAPDVDIRDTFFQAIIDVAREDKDIMVLSADMDAFKLRDFEELFPEQFLNVGVSEQNMINVAAGLALTGKKVFCYSIAAFATLRCFEQIKIHIGSMELPVSIVGAGAGFSFGYDGPTHHGHQDLSSMRLIPEMEIIELSSSEVAREAIKSLVSNPRPSYVRLDKGPFPDSGVIKADFSIGLRIMRSDPSATVAIVSNGYMLRVADEVCDFLVSNGVSTSLVDLFLVKPINTEALQRALTDIDMVVTIEESCTSGGLSTSLLEEREKLPKKWEQLSIGAPNQQFIEYGSREWFHEKYGLTATSIGQKIVDYINKKNL